MALDATPSVEMEERSLNREPYLLRREHEQPITINKKLSGKDQGEGSRRESIRKKSRKKRKFESGKWSRVMTFCV